MIKVSSVTTQGMTTHLAAGMPLDAVRRTDVVALNVDLCTEGDNVSCNGSVKAVETTPEWRQQILLSGDEEERLKTVTSE